MAKVMNAPHAGRNANPSRCPNVVWIAFVTKNVNCSPKPKKFRRTLLELEPVDLSLDPNFSGFLERLVGGLFTPNPFGPLAIFI